MFSILSETLMTASRMDGFRYPSDKAAKPYRAEPSRDAARPRAPKLTGRERRADQPL